MHRELDLPAAAKDSANQQDLELKGYSFDALQEDTRPARRVRVGLIQNKIVLPTTAPVSAQRDALLEKIGRIIGIAHQCGVNIVCMQEAWSKCYIKKKEISVFYTVSQYSTATLNK